MSSTKVITDPGIRFSYANVFTPTAVGAEEPKYNVCLLIDKNDKKNLALINAAIDAAIAEGKASMWKGKLPANFKHPLHDGDTEKPDDENYAGMMYLNARSKNAPQVVDAKGVRITDAEDFYSGCYGRASFNFFPYNKQSNGVGCGLGNLQKLEDGERLAGGSSAADDFGLDSDDLL